MEWAGLFLAIALSEIAPEMQAGAFPPESVCEACYRAAEKEHDAALHRYQFAGGWTLLVELTEAKRQKDAMWAAWWITWHKVTPEQRRVWVIRWRQLLAPVAPEPPYRELRLEPMDVI